MEQNPSIPLNNLFGAEAFTPPVGWNLIDSISGKYYLVSGSSYSKLSDAKAAASLAGGRLAIPNTTEVNNLLKSAQQTGFIGLEKKTTHGNGAMENI